MQPQSRNLLVFIVLSMLLVTGWQALDSYLNPPKPRPKTPPSLREAARTLAQIAAVPAILGAGPGDVAPHVVAEWVRSLPPDKLLATSNAPKPKPKPKAEPAAPPAPPVVLGNDTDFELQVTLDPRGASVAQVILNRFDQATEMGLPEKPPTKLHLLGGAHTPSFVMLHYDRPESEHPRAALGLRNWDVEKLPDREVTEGGRTLKVGGVRFSTTLAEQGVKVVKTYTLRSGDYHVGLDVQVTRLADAAHTTPFRYQLSTGEGLPIEGVWYTTVFRNAFFGWTDASGRFRRLLEDSGTITYAGGGDGQSRAAGSAFRYGGVAVQYFASMLVVDNEQENQKFLDRLRATAETPSPDKGRPHLGDITVRAVTEPAELKPGEGLTHKYLLYHGPIKVRLLRQLQDSQGRLVIDPALVDRYEHTLNLSTLTDYPMQNIFGSIASFLGWSNLLILTTNMMHSGLWYLHQVVPNYALCIILLTVLVRLCLFPLTRRQILVNMRFQEQLKKLKPEFDKLQQKYGDDVMAMSQARNELMRRHGVNPMAPLAGCLPLLIQMPIFMGLYYALQESIFFRLEPLLKGLPWIPNLAAPDMLVWWGEWMPFISDRASMGGPFYLGPYFNLLPLIAVVLMFIQQMMLMPPPTNEQEATSQSMMKWMTAFFGIMFYKVPAGLCMYFVISSCWGLTERKLIPKVVHPHHEGDGPKPEGAAAEAESSPAAGNGTGGGARRSGKAFKAGGKPKRKAERERARQAAEEQDDTLVGKLKAAWQKVLDEAKKK
jgi:YidC/Oxa1 family membrane protein insertase